MQERTRLTERSPDEIRDELRSQPGKGQSVSDALGEVFRGSLDDIRQNVVERAWFGRPTTGPGYPRQASFEDLYGKPADAPAPNGDSYGVDQDRDGHDMAAFPGREIER